MNGHELITKELDRYVPARGWSSNTLGLERMVALVDALGLNAVRQRRKALRADLDR